MKNWKYIIFLLLCYFITSNAWAIPDPITNLTALTGSGDGEVDLTWIYPGPGDLPENEQYAIQHSTYIIEWSTSSADIFIDTGPVITSALQSYTVTGLTNEATYFFRIWTSSSSITEWSPISYGATTWVNIVPSKITNLSALAGYKQITLNWTAPGDNGMSGNIEGGKYEIRCSTTKAFVINNDWDNASTGYPYRISWGTDTAPGNCETRVITGLINNVTYYFAIKTRDEIIGNWSVLNSTSPIPYALPFNSPPYVNLSSPANSTIVSTQTPIFDWVGSDPDPGDSITYTIRYSTKQNFEVFSSSEGLTVSSYTPTSDLIENATYWWSVLAIDSEDYETLSETWTIRINATNDYAPEPFNLVSSSGIVTTQKPSFDWQDSSDDDPGDTITYSMWYSTNSDFIPLNQKTGLTESTYTVTSDLIENATYYWKVMAMDSGNPSLIRESNQLDWYIRINAANQSPNDFSLLTPSNTVTTLEPTFEWDTAVDPDPGDTVEYLLYYSTYSNFSSSTTEPVSQTSYTPTSNLLDEVTYYWKVKALDEDSSALDKMSTEQNWEFYTKYDDPPTAFGLLLPFGTTTFLKPNFKWEHNEPLGGDPWDSVTYTLYYSTYSNYQSSTSVWELVDVSTTPDSNLLDNATYFWKVQAFDGAGNSTWSNEISSYFWTNVINDTPTAFGLISPVNNSTSTVLTPVFDWEDSSDKDPGESITYTLYYSSYSDFSSSITVTGLSTSTCNSETLQDNSTYFWKVKAVDGSTETWSNETTWLFWTNQSNDTPENFGLISPANNSTSTVLTPVFDWHDSTDVDPNDSITYTLYYSSYADFSSSITVTGLSTSTHTPGTDLNDNSTYYWKVTAYDTNGAFKDSTEDDWLFWTNVINDTPTVFGLISPADSITIIGQKPDFNWYDSIDIDPNDSVTYILYYSTYATYDSSTTVQVSVSSHTPSFDLSDDSTYYWKVKAYDTNGAQRWSTETNWKFLTNVSNDPPGAFELNFPTNSYVTTDLTPDFDWENSYDPNPVDTVTYTLCYSTYSTYDSSTTVQLSVSSYTPSIPLQDNTTYFWKVKAEDNVSTGTWSNETTWLFWTNVENDTPTAFGLISPANDHVTSNLKPTFIWNNSSDVDPGDSITYILYYSTYSTFLSSYVISLTDLTYTPPGNLNENATYWWKVRADDLNGAIRGSNQTNWKFFVRLLHTPKVVEGVKGNLSSDRKNFSLSWNPVTHNTDGSTVNDLGGYHIYRSDLISSLGDGTPAATVGAATLNWTDDTVNKRIFYYVVNAFDTSGNESENSVIVDSSRDENVIAVSKDQEALLVIPNEINKVLYSQNNSYGDDLKIIVERNNADEKGKVIRSWEFKVLKCSDNTEIENFKFDSPAVDIQLAYENGSQMAGSFGKAVFHAPCQSDSQVGIFWHNSVEYVKLGGHIDSNIKAINLKSMSMGKYRVQQVQRATEFELSWVGTIGPTKVFTPNEDTINDEINFVFENPKESIASGEIYDITGALIASMEKGQKYENSLMWNGKTKDGEIADKGGYIYQIKAEGKIINGTVILAK